MARIIIECTLSLRVSSELSPTRTKWGIPMGARVVPAMLLQTSNIQDHDTPGATTNSVPLGVHSYSSGCHPNSVPRASVTCQMHQWSPDMSPFRDIRYHRHPELLYPCVDTATHDSSFHLSNLTRLTSPMCIPV